MFYFFLGYLSTPAVKACLVTTDLIIQYLVHSTSYENNTRILVHQSTNLRAGYVPFSVRSYVPLASVICLFWVASPSLAPWSSVLTNGVECHYLGENQERRIVSLECLSIFEQLQAGSSKK